MSIIGVKGIKGNLPAGVGFIIIPDGVDPEEYKKDVFTSGRVSIFGGYGYGNFYNVLIDKDTLQRIKFPKKVGDMGTAVVWINMPKHDDPIIVAALKYDKEYFDISEDRRRETLTHKDNFVDLDLDAKRGKIGIRGGGKEMEFDIHLSDKNSKAKFRIRVDGEIVNVSSDRNVAISNKRIERGVADKENINKARTVLSSEENEDRYKYEDEFGNKISANEERFEIRADQSSKINLGDGKEQLVLGNTLKSLLDEYDDALAKMTVSTAFGPSSTRINAAEFQAVREKFETFLSKLSNTD